MSYKYEFILSKTGDMVYISHLDLIRLLGRSARRAQIKVDLSKGFSPHLKIKMKKALKLGVSSEREEGEMILSEYLEGFDIARRWQNELPDGITIKEVKSC